MSLFMLSANLYICETLFRISTQFWLALRSFVCQMYLQYFDKTNACALNIEPFSLTPRLRIGYSIINHHAQKKRLLFQVSAF